MLNKFKTAIIGVAFQSNPRMPRPLRDAVEHDMTMLVNIYTSVILSEKREEFFKKLGEFCTEQMIDYVRNLDASAIPSTNTVKVCDDWTKGLRTPQGRCTNCGAKH